jgi:hypothetical protein
MMPRPSSDGLDNGYPQSFGGRSNNRSQPNFQQNPSGYSQDNEQQLRQRFSMVGASAPPTLSPHGGGGGGSGGMDQGMMPNQQQQQHQQQHQQQQQMGYAGNRHDMSRNSPNTSSINAMGGGGGHGHQQQQQYQIGDLSPTLAHRMQMNAGGMGSSGMYQQQMGNNPSPNYASAMEMDSRGVTPTGPATGGAPTASTTPGGSLSQADREEELLLNLLIARRQRGSRMSADGGRNAQSLADELMRLRQSRSQASSSAQQMGQSSRGSHMPPVPGLPPLYTEPGGSSSYLPAGNMGGGSGAGGGGGGMPSYESYVRQSSDHMMSAMQDASERIERPSRLLDARSQGQDVMRDFSGRGLKRPAHMGGSMGEFGNLKYPTAMGMQGYDVPPVKKKRTHKKKPADMPRRPLSAYNLFFSEERERILKEIDVKDGSATPADSTSKDEDTAKEESNTEATEGEDDSDKPKALMRPLIPAQKKRRPHRKTHGKISFQQLARMVGERWKALPDDQRKYYQGLAEADMKRQKVAMEEYYAKQNASKEEIKGESKEGDAEMDTDKETEKEEEKVVVGESKAVGVGL